MIFDGGPCKSRRDQSNRTQTAALKKGLNAEKQAHDRKVRGTPATIANSWAKVGVPVSIMIHGAG